MEKLTYNVARFFLYIPTIAIPIVLFKITNEYIYASIGLTIWLCLNYYIIQSNYVTKLVEINIGLVILAFLVIRQKELFLIVLLISDGILGECVRRILFQFHDEYQNYFTLSGMLSVGIIFLNIKISVFFLLFVFLLFVWSIFNRRKEKEQRNFILSNNSSDYKLNKWGLLFAIIHNLHYYCFAFLIPVLAYIYKVPILAGTFVAINWALFLIKDRINLFFLRKYTQDKIIVSSYIILSAIYLLLYLFGENLNVIEIGAVLLFQGGVSGLAEEFWKLEDMNNIVIQSGWKIAGIIGAVISVILSVNNTNWHIYFMLPAIFTGFLSIVYIGDNLWKK